MQDILIDFANLLISGLASAISAILSLLPGSPFSALDNTPIQQYIGYVNWFIPVYDIELELAACCASILIYYAYQVFMRWGKVVE